MSDEFRLARADELFAVSELCARAFERGTPSEWAADLDRDPWREQGAHLVAVSDGRIVASVRLLARSVDSASGEVRLAGFGDVASDPGVRRGGYVRRLLALAHERNRAAGFDLAMLFTGLPWVYSGGGGFSIVPFWSFELDTPGTPLSAAEYTIVTGDPVAHLAGMRQVYEQFGRGRPGYPLRGDAYWSHPTRLTQMSGVRIALDRSGRVVAYMRVRVRSEERVDLVEYPYVDGDAAYALLADLSTSKEYQSTTLRGLLPHDHAAGRAPGARWVAREHSMVHAYTDTGARLIAEWRSPSASERSVYWSADSF